MATDSDEDDLIQTLLDEECEEEERGEPNEAAAAAEEIDDLNRRNHHHHQQHQQPLEQQHYLQSIGATISTRQLASRGLSFQLWPAAASLVSLLDRDPSPLLLPSSPPLRIIELGSGTGLAGIAAAAILGADVTLTDLPHVLPNLRFNAEANAAVVAARGGSVSVRRLSWGDDEDEREISKGVPFNAVMASDVVYYEHLFEPLLKTLRVLVRGEVGFVMAHLRRWKKRDSVFFKRARKLFDIALVHSDRPSPGSRIGVAVYRFTARDKQHKLEQNITYEIPMLTDPESASEEEYFQNCLTDEQ